MEAHDRRQLLDFRDFNRPEIAAETPYTLSQLNQRMYVQTPDGAWHGGFWGWIEILNVIPRYHWLGTILRGVPFRWAGPSIYNFFARNRYRLPRVLLRILGVPAQCDESCALPAQPR